MYASRISLPARAELLNCLCMLARRCCGREAILNDVRRAAEDMTRQRQFSTEKYKIRRRKEALASRKEDYHMAANFRWTRGARRPRVVEGGTEPRCAEGGASRLNASLKSSTAFRSISTPLVLHQMSRTLISISRPEELTFLVVSHLARSARMFPSSCRHRTHRDFLLRLQTPRHK
jgi:hypothetical protein